MLSKLRSMSEGKSKVQPVNTDSDGMKVSQEVPELHVDHGKANEEHEATAAKKEEELDRTLKEKDTAAKESDRAPENAMRTLESFSSSRNSEHNLPPLLSKQGEC